MDITEIKKRALAFKEELDAKKTALTLPNFSWYPYGTLYNFHHLDRLLTGKHRLLLDLIAEGPVADIGCGDGDLAFFMETLGCRVDVVDLARTNHNGLRGVRLLKNELSSTVEIHQVDLDAQFRLPQKNYNVAFFLGILYHLKNPYYVLETLAPSAKYCLLSTRIAKFNRRDAKFDWRLAKLLPDWRTNFSQLPVAYLLHEWEANNDPTNYWIFSEAGLRRLFERTGWDVCDYLTVGNTINSDPASAEGDERAFCLLESRRFEPIVEEPQLIEDEVTVNPSEPGYLSFRCNICGQMCTAKAAELDRETPSCTGCGSTVRARSIIHLLSTELFGESLALPDFPERPDIRGIGMSDWEGYAEPLAQKLNYQNTYYHQEPKLDITSIDPALEGTLDFVICSEVFEHVPPPVSIAFENLRRLLKPGGVAIFTVPYTKEQRTTEHFPELYDYQIVETDGHYSLRNTTRDGIVQEFNGLVFHGGPGSTLEMRVFSESSLHEEFRKAGFNEIKVYKSPDFEHGIYWSYDWSLPVSLRLSKVHQPAGGIQSGD